MCDCVIKVWKEQIQKAKDLYEEAKVASASQIDRFYLSYCGGNVTGNPAMVSDRNVIAYPDHDSDQVRYDS